MLQSRPIDATDDAWESAVLLQLIPRVSWVTSGNSPQYQLTPH